MNLSKLGILKMKFVKKRASAQVLNIAQILKAKNKNLRFKKVIKNKLKNQLNFLK